jgi:serine/threonine protein kinase
MGDLDLETFLDGCVASDRQRYTVERVLGKGSYGTVVSALDHVDGCRVAIKCVHGVFDDLGDAERVLREVVLARLLRAEDPEATQDVVAFRRLLLPADRHGFDRVYLVFERMDTDLHSMLRLNCGEGDLSPEHHRVFAYQLVRGVALIHSKGVLHRDLKPQNVLVDDNCNLKICDFGLARVTDTSTSTSPVDFSDYICTRWYRPPELCNPRMSHATYTSAVDVWSVGCIFAEILGGGRVLFPGADAEDQLERIHDLVGEDPTVPASAAARLRAELPRKSEDEAIDLLRRMLVIDPRQRITALEALRHPYFSGLGPTDLSGVKPLPPDALDSRDCLRSAAAVGQESRKRRRGWAMARVMATIYDEALRYRPESAAAAEAAAANPAPSTIPTPPAPAPAHARTLRSSTRPGISSSPKRRLRRACATLGGGPVAVAVV